MSAGLDLVTGRGLAGERDRSRPPAWTRQMDQRFYTVMAIGFIVIAFAGFARTLSA